MKQTSQWRAWWAAILTAAAPCTARAAGGSASQPAALPHTDPKTAIALVVRGVRLYKAHDYDGARGVFAKAYVLDPLPGTLLDVALSELKADQPVEAAAHFREYLKASGEPKEKLDAVRATYLPLAERSTARLDVYAPRSMQVRIDGAPLEPSVRAADEGEIEGRFAAITVRAGEHEVTARDGPEERTQRVTAPAGEVVDIHLAAPKPAPTEPEPPTPAPADPNSAKGRASWIPVVALGSGAIVAAGLGVAFALLARDQASDVQRTARGIDPEGAGSACSGAAAASGPCMALRDETQAARRNWALSIASYAGAGVFGAGSVVAWTLGRAKPLAGASAGIAPSVGARSAGLSFHGDW